MKHNVTSMRAFSLLEAANITRLSHSSPKVAIIYLLAFSILAAGFVSS